MDFIAMGRINVDFYPCEMNVPFGMVKTFRKSIGGSPANIAVGTARLGIKTGFIGKVSGDALGSYILDFFDKEGIDTSQIKVDGTGAMNCIAVTEVKSPEDCSAIIYRDNVADVRIEPSDVSEDYIKEAKILLVSGTALSRSPSREAVFTALSYANKHGVQTYLDLDYRAMAWDSPAEASRQYRRAAGMCNVIIGTKEEIGVVKLSGDYKFDVDMVIIKYGKDGSAAFLRDGTMINGAAFPAKAIKTYGAGDAYASALIYGVLEKMEFSQCLEYAAASASIVVSREACGESSPTLEEIKGFVAAVKTNVGFAHDPPGSK